MIENFEQWWSGLDGSPGEVLWDADPDDLTADLAVIGEAFDPGWPVVDFGCGDGRQTRYLATHFTQVVGTDFAAGAIDRARATDNPPNVSYRVLDAREPGQAQQLHRELGDVNVYIQGMLHALPPTTGPAAVRRVERLLGTAGAPARPRDRCESPHDAGFPVPRLTSTIVDSGCQVARTAVDSEVPEPQPRRRHHVARHSELDLRPHRAAGPRRETGAEPTPTRNRSTR